MGERQFFIRFRWADTGKIQNETDYGLKSAVLKRSRDILKDPRVKEAAVYDSHGGARDATRVAYYSRDEKTGKIKEQLD